MSNAPLAENEHLFTSESVTEGHPDKVSDQISDAVLDAVMAHGEGEEARVACETLVNTNLVVISGEIRTEAKLDLDAIARETIREIGYDGFDPNFGADTVEVMQRMDQQSADIAQGVDAAQEARE
ncbi:MAG: S-adenosylmethionine synthetase, partial [Solirubrobacterales bacterium]|nr:S-adenosylmethionine synthetase [Solirubrobacterales bacterium]